MSSAQQLFDAAGRRRSPATMPVITPEKHRGPKARGIRPIHRPWMRSSQ